MLAWIITVRWDRVLTSRPPRFCVPAAYSYRLASMKEMPGNQWTETEAAIMEATFRAIREHGYADLTLRKIADEFEKSRGLIYQHYPNREELFAALVQYLTDQYETHMALEEAVDPAVRLERYLDTALFGPDDPEFDHWAFHTALLEFRIQGRHNETLRSLLDRGYDRVLDIVRAILEDGIERDAFREVDPDRTARLLVGIVDAARLLRVSGADETAPERFRAALSEVVLPGIYATGPEDPVDRTGTG